MLRNRKVGTLTFGLILVSAGALYLLRLIVPTINLQFVFSFWPVIFILFGMEVLMSYFLNKEEKLLYDGRAIFLSIFLTIFSVFLAGAEYLIHNLDYIIEILRRY